MRGMGPKEIYDLLEGVETWEKATRRQRLLFVGEMKGRQYGYEAITSAWGWFIMGMKAK